MTDAVVFDFDGTLYQDEETAHDQFMDTLNDELARNGIQQPKKILANAQKAIETGTHTSTCAFLTETLEMPIEPIKETVHEQTLETISATSREQLIDQYDRTYSLIFTNNSEHLVDLFLREHDRHVDKIIGAETLEELKPSEEAFQTCTEAVPCPATETVFIDDTKANRRTAKKYGFTVQDPARIEVER